METPGNFTGSGGDLGTKVADAARPAVDRAAATAHQTVDSLAGAANEAVDSLSTKGAQLREFQDRLVSNSCAYVQEHPMTSIGIALATGFLISKLLNNTTTH